MLFQAPGIDVPPREPPTMPLGTLERQYVDVSCGRVAYLRHGSGPPLLLVHGIPTSARLWEPLLGALGERFDCIAPDLLGLGRSRPVTGAPLDSQGQAAMLAELLDALGIAQTRLVLHDQGGAHGMRFLAGFDERVRALALCDIVCYDNWLVPVVAAMGCGARWPRGLHFATRAGLDRVMRTVFPFPQTAVRGPLPDALGEDWTWAMRTGGAPLRDWCAYVRAQSPRSTMESIPVLQAWTKPTLVMWAAGDRFLSPSWAARLADDIPGVGERPVLLPFAGHFFHADVPATAAQALSDFFASV
jgi:pimeloyl-ACP methyl ester carboxylesterase